jgi:hypothetical protein
MRGNNAAALTDGGDTPYIRGRRATRAERAEEAEIAQEYRDILWRACKYDEETYHSAIHYLTLKGIYAKKRREGWFYPGEEKIEALVSHRYVTNPKIMQALAVLAQAVEEGEARERDRLLES